jgi:hypothetical protein
MRMIYVVGKCAATRYDGTNGIKIQPNKQKTCAP